MEQSDRQFRDALGAFATGITVVTTTDQNGKPFGMTANSFSSVSLNPPLILWSAGDHSEGYETFCDCEHFAVHILRSDQQDLSNIFATKGSDKFASVSWVPGQLGSPLLEDCSVRFECRKEANYPGGDHTILVGRVVHFDNFGDQSPLIFHMGQYRQLS